jgi:hypothetical protein
VSLSILCRTCWYERVFWLGIFRGTYRALRHPVRHG